MPNVILITRNIAMNKMMSLFTDGLHFSRRRQTTTNKYKIYHVAINVRKKTRYAFGSFRLFSIGG